MADRSALIDDEAGEDSEDDAEYVDSSEEDDEEGDEDDARLRQEGADFIVDEDAEDEGEGAEGEAGAEEKVKKRKKRRKKRLLALDDEDLALVAENTGRTIKRQRRVFKQMEQDGIADDFDIQDLQDLQDEEAAEPEPSGRSGPVGRSRPPRRTEPSKTYSGGEEEGAGSEEREESFEDDLDGFIEHDAGVDRDEYRRRRRALAKTARSRGISTDAMEELLALFGSDADIQALVGDWLANNAHDAAEAERRRVAAGIVAPDPEAEHDDDGAGAETAATAAEAADPALAAQLHMTGEGVRVRQANMAERLFQLQDSVPELSARGAAEHIFDAVFAPSAPDSAAKAAVEEGMLPVDDAPPERAGAMAEKYVRLEEAHEGWLSRDGEDGESGAPRMDTETGEQMGTFRRVRGVRFLRKPRQRRARVAQWERVWQTVEDWWADDAAQEAVRDAIAAVIKLIFHRHLEVPVIAMFFKASLGELLALRPEDAPAVLSGAEADKLTELGIELPAGAMTADKRAIRRWDALWAVFNEARRYFGLLAERELRLSQLRKSPLEEEVQEALAERIESARGEELNDIAAHVRMLSATSSSAAMGALSFADGAGSAARPSRRPRHATLRADGVGDLAARLAISTEAFAENVGTIGGAGGAAGLAVHTLAATLRQVLRGGEQFDPRQIARAWLTRDYSGTLFGETAFAGDEDAAVRAVLAAVRELLVQEMAAHPDLRAAVRRLVAESASISTAPTEAGDAVLSPFHVHGCVKRIRAKPFRVLLADFPEQWLHMKAAEEKGLLTVKFEVPEAERGIQNTLHGLYAAEVSGDTDTVHRAVVAAALRDHLVPDALRALRSELAAAAERRVLAAAQDALWLEATLPPLRLRAAAVASDDDDTVPQAPIRHQRVCAVCYGERRDAAAEQTQMVMLDARGYPLDVLHLPQFSGVIPSGSSRDKVRDDERKATDVGRIAEFVRKHWPHVIVVGASSPECRQLARDIENVVNGQEIDQSERNANIAPISLISVRVVHEHVAAVYAASAFAASDLGDYDRRTRRAVALGRSAIAPLATLAALAGPGWELLQLPLDPLQERVAEEARREALEQTLLTVVAQVGVEINALAAVDWLAPLLALVPGLGPIKAQALLQELRRLPETDDPVAGPLPARTLVARDNLLAAADGDAAAELEAAGDPWTPVRQLGDRVYTNAAPFLRVRDAAGDDAAGDEDVDDAFAPKDGLRVHPKDESLLQTLARFALDRSDAFALERGEDAVPIAIVKPDKVMSVNIGKADELWRRAQAEGDGGDAAGGVAGDPHAPVVSTLVDLQFELIAPYGDPRASERPPLTEAEQFYALAGEAPEALREGALVAARVVRVFENHAFLRTDSGVACVLDRMDANTRPLETLVGNMQTGQELHGRVVRIEFDSGRLRLCSSSAALADGATWERRYLAARDPYYHVLSDAERREAEHRMQARLRKRSFQSRPIQHARFANVLVTRAREALLSENFAGLARVASDLGRTHPSDGDAIFHPSPRGPARLSLTIRLISVPFRTDQDPSPLIQNLDLLETKAAKAGAHLTLGTPLRVHHLFDYLDAGDCEFEDLDEVLVNFVRPYCTNFADVAASPKFVPGPLEDVKAHLAMRTQAQADYRLGLFVDDTPALTAAGHQRPGIGWGFIAFQTSREAAPHHFVFRISHSGFYVSLYPFTERKSIQVPTVSRMIAEMKRAISAKMARDRQAPPPSMGMGLAAVPPRVPPRAPYPGGAMYPPQPAFGGAPHFVAAHPTVHAAMRAPGGAPPQRHY